METRSAEYKKLANVSGWLARVDYEIFCSVLDYQNECGYVGAVVEIGTHHGKSFVPLVRSNGGSKAYVIDIFDSQELNIDHSGSGDRQAFFRTLDMFGIDAGAVVVDSRLSSDVTADDILGKVGISRFFHIDGGHHLDAVINDVRLAVATTAADGVIAVDDVFRPEWPEVSMAVFGSGLLDDAGFCVFAIGFNKTYWCKRDRVEAYQEALLRNPILVMAQAKTYHANNNRMLVFQRSPLPEWPLRLRIRWYLELYHPELALRGYTFFRRYLKGVRGY